VKKQKYKDKSEHPKKKPNPIIGTISLKKKKTYRYFSTQSLPIPAPTSTLKKINLTDKTDRQNKDRYLITVKPT
jgi:hypothetical protein